MPDTVTSQIYDGARNVVVHLNSVSDGTGQDGVVILDPLTLVPPAAFLRLKRAHYDIYLGGVNIEWDGAADRSMIALSGSHTRDYTIWGGPGNDALLATGLIRISTAGFVANSGYSITLEFVKAGPVGPNVGMLVNAIRPLIGDEIPSAAPVNRDVPAIYGPDGLNGKPGQRLTCTMGNWENDPNIYMYQWQSDGKDAVIGTTNETYLITRHDAGHSITCIVTAANIHGATVAPVSNAIAVAGAAAQNQTRRSILPRRGK